MAVDTARGLASSDALWPHPGGDQGGLVVSSPPPPADAKRRKNQANLDTFQVGFVLLVFRWGSILYIFSFRK